MINYLKKADFRFQSIPKFNKFDISDVFITFGYSIKFKVFREGMDIHFLSKDAGNETLFIVQYEIFKLSDVFSAILCMNEFNDFIIFIFNTKDTKYLIDRIDKGNVIDSDQYLLEPCEKTFEDVIKEALKELGDRYFYYIDILNREIPVNEFKKLYNHNDLIYKVDDLLYSNQLKAEILYNEDGYDINYKVYHLNNKIIAFCKTSNEGSIVEYIPYSYYPEIKKRMNIGIFCNIWDRFSKEKEMINADYDCIISLIQRELFTIEMIFYTFGINPQGKELSKKERKIAKKKYKKFLKK